MGVFEQTPWTNFHGVNLSWIINETKTNAEDIDTVAANVGSLSDLDTSAKSSIVDAINELVEGGGYGPTTSYNSLTDKPSINGVTLSGNKTTANLGISYDALASRPQINGVTLTGNKTTAQLGIDYDELSGRPQINGVTLTGDKSASDLGINYSSLDGIPIPPALGFSISSNGSRTITLSGTRCTILLVGGHISANLNVMVFLQAFKPSTGSASFTTWASDGNTDRITFTGDGTNYTWTVANTGSGTFSFRAFVLQGTASLA